LNLYTRCAHCETVFRVTTRDLQASSGRVRCGHCHRVFDAFATLSAQDPVAGDPAPQALADASTPARVTARQPEAEARAADIGRIVDTKESTAPAEPKAPASAPATASRTDPAADLYEWEFKVAPPPRRTALWSLLSLLLLAIGGVQAAYAFRTGILLSYPQTRPLYEMACEWAGCHVGLPRLADMLHIEASDLQVADPGRGSEVELTALVRNRAPAALEYPAFELTLTNASEQVIARRVFLPSEYLGPGVSEEDGLRGRGEFAIKLLLDTGTVRASGYRLYLFYPS
jgi:predicted Zn finger-like uncharacterized protein